jgi:hypothetical protein
MAAVEQDGDAARPPLAMELQQEKGEGLVPDVLRAVVRVIGWHDRLRLAGRLFRVRCDRAVAGVKKEDRIARMDGADPRPDARQDRGARGLGRVRELADLRGPEAELSLQHPLKRRHVAPRV